MKRFSLMVPLGYSQVYGERESPAVPKEVTEVIGPTVFMQTCVRHLGDGFYEVEIRHQAKPGSPLRYNFGTERVAGRSDESMRFSSGVHVRARAEALNVIELIFSLEPLP